MKRHPRLLLILGFLLPVTRLAAGEGNRLTYLDEVNPYYVSQTFPKLVTPQWIGEPGVEAVVVLAIDDMRGHERWETYLRPILERLKRIDGRAPVSIMTCQIQPKEPHLQRWLREGLSLEVHTIDHPCPLLCRGDLAAARSTYDRCVDLLNQVPGNRPVAFRMPCCDSLNTQSPRFFTEIFAGKTAHGHYLAVDSSVFNVFTTADRELPPALVTDVDGQERFAKYLPADRSFVNTIENYPYPYVIGGLCWEFPCVTPSDWQAQHLHKPANPTTIRDMKAAIDLTVAKKGVFNLVFHPYNWIRNDQVVEIIDHAVARHGKKIKFLTFREALERINENFLGGQALRRADGGDNGVRVLDLDNDGYLDVVIGNDRRRLTRIWEPRRQGWKLSEFPCEFVTRTKPVKDTQNPQDVRPDRSGARVNQNLRFGVLQSSSCASLFDFGAKLRVWHFGAGRWSFDSQLSSNLSAKLALASDSSRDQGFRLRDLDGDGRCEIIVGGKGHQAVYSLAATTSELKKLPFGLPQGVALVDAAGRDNGVRFVDVDGDGSDDVISSNETGYSLDLFDSMQNGWRRRVLSGSRTNNSAIPIIARNGVNNGAWFHSRHLWIQNEHTDLLRDHVDRRSFNALLANAEPVALSPEVALKTLHPRPGFEVELMASEPLVQDPIAFAWGADGKFWVVEMGDYPLGTDGKGKPGGRIKFLEDSKGRGKYDKATVFLDNLAFPTGVMPWRRGVLVTCAPEIFYAEDTDGDGRADVRQPLFIGFHEGNQQHRVNGLVWGLDNWVHAANGDSGGKIRSSKTGAMVDLRGRDFRIRPDEGLIDLQTGQSQFGRCQDDWGNWFGCNNANPMYHFALADHYLRRNPHYLPPDPRVSVSILPGPSPVYPLSRTLARFNDFWALNRFTSACSAIVYRDELFGPAYANNTFVSEPVHNLIHREIMSPKGSTFASRRAPDEQRSEFLASTDNWFRPTMISTGPDGALWVADMYRHVIEHPEWIPSNWQRKLDLRAGHDKGRIYRIYPSSRRPRPIPRLGRLNTADLVAALDSPNGWQRDMVQQLLVQRRDTAAVPLLTRLAAEAARPLARLHALCTLDGLGRLEREVVRKAFHDPHPGVRRHAVRLWESRLSDSAEGQELATLVHDPDLQVRMQLAYTLGAWHDPQAGQMLGRLLVGHVDDPYITAAVFSSLNSANLQSVLLAVFADEKASRAYPAMAERLMAMAHLIGGPATLATLLEKLAGMSENRVESWHLNTLSGLLDVLDQRNESLASLAAGTNAALHRAVSRLGPLFASARIIAADPAASLSARRDAIRLLGRGLDRISEDTDLLTGFLAPQVPAELQAAAVAALGRLREPRTATLLLAGWRAYGPTIRAQVLDVMLQRENWTESLLQALEARRVLPLELDAARAQRLTEHRTVRLRERARKLLTAAGTSDRQQVLESYRAVLSMPGDAVRGTAVFKKSCANCHQLGGIGQVVGPDLASLGDKSPAGLLIAILDPNRAVEARYLNYLATTKNGLSHTGVLLGETGTSLTIVSQDGKRHEILRTDLDELVGTNKSAMPEGLEKDLRPQDLADVIAFIRSGMPALAPKQFDGSRPEIVKPGPGGKLILRSTNCAIYGSTLVLEKQFGNLGYWSSADDHAVWTVHVPKSGKYVVWFEWACHRSAAGDSFLLDAGLNRLTGVVQSTGSWEDYRKARQGTIRLEAGEQQLALRAAGKIRSALIDLRTIELIPSVRD